MIALTYADAALYVAGLLTSGVAIGGKCAIAWLTWHDRPKPIPVPPSYRRGKVAR